MKSRVGGPDRSVPATEVRRDLELELEIGFRIEEYHWVEWNGAFPLETPRHQPGRFIGHPGDLLAHCYAPAHPDALTAPEAYANLPRYASEVAPALRAAERAGLFAGKGATLSCRRTGQWRVSVERTGLDLEDEVLPRLLCRAALRLLARERTEEEV